MVARLSNESQLSLKESIWRETSPSSLVHLRTIQSLVEGMLAYHNFYLALCGYRDICSANGFIVVILNYSTIVMLTNYTKSTVLTFYLVRLTKSRSIL